jgi:hypothetical protein
MAVPAAHWIRADGSQGAAGLCENRLTTPTPTTVGDTDAGRRRLDILQVEESS